MPENFDVTVVGAGPVGLFLSCELALAGATVLVLEREVDPKAGWKHDFGVRGLNMRSNENFYRRGLLDGIFEESTRPRTFEESLNPTTDSDKKKNSYAGHFAGMMLDIKKIDYSAWSFYIPGVWSFSGAVDTIHMEKVLATRAQALGVKILRGMEINAVVDNGNLVQASTKDETFCSKYLVGCDGARSAVRKLCGFEFDGTPEEFDGCLALCTLDRPEILRQGFNRTGTGLYIGLGSERWYTIDYVLLNKNQALTRDHVEQVLQRVSETNVKITNLKTATRFIARSAQATEYRRGRVLLAGDAAHIHSPLGAQGLNLGLGDAFNLGWKLAAQVTGTASASLLDSYHDERHLVGASVLAWARAQSVALKPDLYGSAMGSILQDLINTGEGATYFAGRVEGMDQRYDLHGNHPLIGRTAPEFYLKDGERLGSTMVKGEFVFIDFEGDDAARKTIQSWRYSLQYIGCFGASVFGLRALLIRPDGIVCWVSTEGLDLASAKSALERWVMCPS